MVTPLVARYVARAVVGRAALALPVLCGVYLAFDLAGGGRPVVSARAVLARAALHLPLVAAQLLPAALLIAAVLALTRLRRDGELVGLAAAGAGPGLLCRPLLVLGLVGAALALLLGELAAPPAERLAERLRGPRPSALTGLRPPAARWSRHGSWFVRLERRQALLVELAPGPGPYRARRRLAGEVFGSPGAPQLRGASVALDERPLVARPFAAALPPLSAAAALATHTAELRPEAQSAPALARRLRRLATAGQDATALALVLHTKLSYPLLVLAAALLGCCFALRAGPPRPLADLGLALAALLALWLLLAGGWLAGRAGWLSPALAGWLPPVLGVALAAALLTARWPRRRGGATPLCRGVDPR